MCRRAFLLALVLPLSLLAATVPVAHAVTLPDGFGEVLVADSLDNPVNFDFLPDGRILLVELQTARIRVIVPGAAEEPPPVGVVDDVGIERVEDGLLGIAIDPRWPEKPYVYVQHVCASKPNLKVARFALTGDLDGTGDGGLTLDTLSRRDVLADLPNDYWFHNGGTLEFGPDGMLYVALGDDGTICLAQDIHQMRGKILRLSVTGIPDGPGPVPAYPSLAPADNPYAQDADPRARLVWHRGLRNPWTFDFDPLNGTMVIADVGESTWEEINVTSEGGRNFGWPIFEGPGIFFPDCGAPDLDGLTIPAHFYGREGEFGGRTAIVGGIAYPTPDSSACFPPDYWGDVFVLDFYGGWLRRLEDTVGGWEAAAVVPGQVDPLAWGEGFHFVPRMRFGPDGGLWYLQGGNLRRIHAAGTVGVGDAPATLAVHPAVRATPNPSAGAVRLACTLPRAASIELTLHDVRGRVVRRLARDEARAVGTHLLTWDGRDERGHAVPTGVYFVTLTADGASASSRLLRLRE